MLFKVKIKNNRKSKTEIIKNMSVHNPDKGLVYRRSQNSKKKKIKEERNLIKSTHFLNRRVTK